MKLRIILTVAALLVSAGLVFAGTNDLTSLLQKGLFEEEANHNLDAALRAYQAAVDEFDKDRQLDATAVFRLGECYRKLGRTNEASVQYERVLREFPDQTNLVKLSSDYLGGANPAALAAEGPDAKAVQLQNAYDDLKLKLTLTERELASVTNLGEQGEENYFTTVKPDSVLVGYLGERSEAEKKISEVRDSGYGPNQPEYKSAIGVAKQVNDRIVQRVGSLVWSLQQEAQVLQSQADGVHTLLEGRSQVGSMLSAMVHSAAGGVATADSSLALASPTSDEDEEVRKIKEMIRNSPDLINAVGSLPGKYGTPLQAVVRDGNIAAAELLLANGANVNAATPETPLGLAAESGNKAMIELLLAKGANVNTKDNDGAQDTPLHYAAERGFKTTAEFLLAHKADVNARNKYGLTALYITAQNGFSAVAELLLACGADVNARTQRDETPLFAAIGNNRAEMVQLLLTNKADINATNLEGESPLFWAIRSNNGELVPLLLAFNPDVNLRNKSGQTPIHLAVHLNQAGTVKLLLAHKADANVVTDAGISPLLLATAMPNVDASLVKSLLENGAEPNAHIPEGGIAEDWAPNNNTFKITSGSNPVELAMKNNRNDLLELLLAAHADTNAPFSNDGGMTPLIWTIERNDSTKLKMVKILLDHKADPDLAYGNGMTPLMYAVYAYNLEIVQALIDHHADVNKPDNYDRPPLAFLLDVGPLINTSRGGYDEAVIAQIKALLLKAGANEDYERLARIFITQKGTGSIGNGVFSKGTSSVNHYTLLELIAEAYKAGGSGGGGGIAFGPIAFPDFAHLVINRLKPNGAKEEIAVNLDEILASGDCSKDVPLEWGDVVQIPQKDHLINEMWQGFSDDSVIYKSLKNCLQRQVQIIVKGQTNTLTLEVQLTHFGLPGLPPMPALPPGFPRKVSSPSGKTFYTFSLNEVVRESNLLLLSSDLSRVKVTRNGVDMYFDLEGRNQSGGGGGRRGRLGGGGGGRGGGGGVFVGGGGFGGVQSQMSSDLWLRDGDVIEIPERDPNAPDAK